LIPRFAARILPVDTEVALLWGDCHARLRAAGLSNIVMDALIAATAVVHGLTVVTRNARAFGPLGIPVLNPWSG
jgi:predicted nucleic acid-binding protein